MSYIDDSDTYTNHVKDSMTMSSFVKVLNEAVNGIVRLEECAKIIANDCLDDVLMRIARDYNMDFTKLKEKYKDDVVDRHATLSSERQTCNGKTSSGKTCSRFAVSGGYCRSHYDQRDSKKEIDIKNNIYVDNLEVKKKDKELVKKLEKMNISVVDAVSLKASRRTEFEFFVV